MLSGKEGPRCPTIFSGRLPFMKPATPSQTHSLKVGRLTGALLDRLTHHVHILTMNGDSYRLAQSTGRRRNALASKATDAAGQKQATAATVDPDTGET